MLALQHLLSARQTSLLHRQAITSKRTKVQAGCCVLHACLTRLLGAGRRPGLLPEDAAAVRRGRRRGNGALAAVLPQHRRARRHLQPRQRAVLGVCAGRLRRHRLHLVYRCALQWCQGVGCACAASLHWSCQWSACVRSSSVHTFQGQHCGAALSDNAALACGTICCSAHQPQTRSVASTHPNP